MILELAEAAELETVVNTILRLTRQRTSIKQDTSTINSIARSHDEDYMGFRKR